MKRLCCFGFIWSISINSLLAQQKSEILDQKFTITLGAGYGFQYNNSLQQSSTTGTPIQLDKYATSQPLALRLQIDYQFCQSKKIRILFSPFNQTGSFTPSNPTNIEGKQFAVGESVNTRFGFNVLRVGFSNKIEEGRFKNFKIGATLAIRKWEASFRSEKVNTSNENLLAVPLLFLGFEKNIGSKLFVNTEIDGLIVPFASVIEGGFSLNYKFSNQILVGVQYRTLAGTYNGTDVKNEFITQSLGLNTVLKF